MFYCIYKVHTDFLVSRGYPHVVRMSKIPEGFVEAIEGFDDNMECNPTQINFRCSINNNEYMELIAYSKVAATSQGTTPKLRFWEFEEIMSHQGPLTMDHKDYNGSAYNIEI